MKDDELKNIWNMINDDTLGFDALQLNKDQIISNRSGSVQNKLRAMLQNDLILKLISGIALLMNLIFYWGTFDVMLICLGGILFHGIITTIEWKTLQGFDRISDPGLSTREALSNILIFLKRKTNIYEICIAASQVLIFVPGLLVYFYLVYGQVKPMTGESFIVYTVLVLLGTFFSYSRIRAQIRTGAADLNRLTWRFRAGPGCRQATGGNIEPAPGGGARQWRREIRVPAPATPGTSRRACRRQTPVPLADAPGQSPR